MNTIELLNKGIDKLKTKNQGIANDSEILLSKILNKTREKMLTSLEKVLTIKIFWNLTD